jgi:hypothetical protein
LHDAGEVLFVERPGGEFACEWRPSLWPVLASEEKLMADLAPPAKREPQPKRRERNKK